MTQEAGTPAGFWERIQKMIDDAVAKLARSGMLRNASISGGGLTIKGGFLRVLFPASLGNALGVYFGDLVDAVTGSYLGTGLLVQGPDGQDIAQFRSDAASGNNLAIITGADGQTVMSSDRVNGNGLDRPFFGGDFQPSRFTDWTLATTSTTFETLLIGYGYHQHAGMLAWVRSSMDTSGATGEVRILVNGAPLGSPTAVGFAVGTDYIGPALVGGAHMSWMTIEVQARVASGAGAIKVGGAGWAGRRP